jgi:uncharacterized protein YbjT (DUF2867 family)
MVILVVGASGVLGRALLPHLSGHRVIGTTRREERTAELRALGVDAAVCDVYVPGALERVALAARPDTVVNLLTDLAGGVGTANARIRREGGPVVVAAARAAGARRLAVESIAFETGADGTAAVAALEAGALGSGLEALVLRFGRLWGPGTWAASPPEPPAISTAEAGRRAAALILGTVTGIHVLAE